MTNFRISITIQSNKIEDFIKRLLLSDIFRFLIFDVKNNDRFLKIELCWRIY